MAAVFCETVKTKHCLPHRQRQEMGRGESGGKRRTNFSNFFASPTSCKNLSSDMTHPHWNAGSHGNPCRVLCWSQDVEPLSLRQAAEGGEGMFRGTLGSDKLLKAGRDVQRDLGGTFC